MLGRALVWATVMLGLTVAVPAGAQNLEAGKPPAQIFSGTCALCHKTPRGLLKSVPPGSLSGFLRQHYTTSTDMAAAMSAYVLSNGAANPAAAGNLTRRGQDAKSGAPAAEPGPERTARGRRHTREAAKPETEGHPQAAAGGEGASPAGSKSARQKAAKAGAAKGEPPPKSQARHEPAKDEPPKTESPKTEPAKTEEPAAGEPARAESTRPDPVPAVTPAPKEPDATEKAPDLAAVPPVTRPNEATEAKEPKEAEPSPGPLTIEIGPAPSPKPPAAAVASAPAVPPAGPPAPPISR